MEIPDHFDALAVTAVDLGELSPVVRAQAQDLVCGAHVGYCMTKAIGAQNDPAR